MKEVSPVFSKAFGDAAKLTAFNMDGEKRKKWKGSEFYGICADAKNSIFGNSSEVRYSIEWSNKERKDARWYEILAELKNGKKARLEWENGKVTLELLSSDEKSLERVGA